MPTDISVEVAPIGELTERGSHNFVIGIGGIGVKEFSHGLHPSRIAEPVN